MFLVRCRPNLTRARYNIDVGVCNFLLVFLLFVLVRSLYSSAFYWLSSCFFCHRVIQVPQCVSQLSCTSACFSLKPSVYLLSSVFQSSSLLSLFRRCAQRYSVMRMISDIAAFVYQLLPRCSFRSRKNTRCRLMISSSSFCSEHMNDDVCPVL